MSSHKVKECIVCGKTYEYCPSCADFKHMEAWHSIYCDENCMEINLIYRDFFRGDITKSVTSRRLKKCDLSNKKNFRKNIQDMIRTVNEKKKK